MKLFVALLFSVAGHAFAIDDHDEALQAAKDFCHYQTKANSHERKLCLHGVQLIEKHPDIEDDLVISGCSSDKRCKEAVWIFRRLIKGSSQAYVSAAAFCRANYGSRQKWPYIASILNIAERENNSCFYTTEFLEQHPLTDDQTIKSLCKDLSELGCLRAYWAFKREDGAPNKLPSEAFRRSIQYCDANIVDNPATKQACYAASEQLEHKPTVSVFQLFLLCEMGEFSRAFSSWDSYSRRLCMSHLNGLRSYQSRWR